MKINYLKKIFFCAFIHQCTCFSVCVCLFISMRANEFGLRARMRIRISNHKGICGLRDDTGGVSAPTKTSEDVMLRRGSTCLINHVTT